MERNLHVAAAVIQSAVRSALLPKVRKRELERKLAEEVPPEVVERLQREQEVAAHKALLHYRYQVRGRSPSLLLLAGLPVCCGQVRTFYDSLAQREEEEREQSSANPQHLEKLAIYRRRRRAQLVANRQEKERKEKEAREVRARCPALCGGVMRPFTPHLPPLLVCPCVCACAACVCRVVQAGVGGADGGGGDAGERAAAGPVCGRSRRHVPADPLLSSSTAAPTPLLTPARADKAGRAERAKLLKRLKKDVKAMRARAKKEGRGGVAVAQLTLQAQSAIVKEGVDAKREEIAAAREEAARAKEERRERAAREQERRTAKSSKRNRAVSATQIQRIFRGRRGRKRARNEAVAQYSRPYDPQYAAQLGPGARGVSAVVRL